MHVVYAEKLEDVVHARHQLHVGGVAVHEVGLGGQGEEQGVALVALQGGVVLVGEGAPHALEGDVLAPLEVLDEGDAVEQLAAEVPAYGPEDVAVVEELHVAHHGECVFVLEVGDVDGGHDEQREGHLAPLCAGVEVVVEIAPAAQPEALVDAGGGEVHLVLAAEEVLEAHGVVEGELGGVEIDGPPLLLGVDIGLAGAELEAYGKLGGAYLLHQLAVGEPSEVEVAGGLVALGLELGVEAESPVGLVVEGEPLAVVEVHLFHLLHAEGHEDIVLVVDEEFVGGRHHVACALEGDVALRKLEGHVALLVERVGDL